MIIHWLVMFRIDISEIHVLAERIDVPDGAEFAGFRHRLCRLKLSINLHVPFLRLIRKEDWVLLWQRRIPRHTHSVNILRISESI